MYFILLFEWICYENYLMLYWVHGCLVWMGFCGTWGQSCISHWDWHRACQRNRDQRKKVLRRQKRPWGMSSGCLLNLCLGFEVHSQGKARIASGREEEAPAENPKHTWVDRKVKVSYLEIMLLTTLHLEFYCFFAIYCIHNSYIVLNTFGEGRLSFISQSNNSSWIWELLACTVPCTRC